MMAIVNGLVPDSSYYLRVVTLNEETGGLSGEAPFVDFRTSCDAPWVTLDKLKVQKINSSIVNLSWILPTNSSESPVSWDCSNFSIHLSFNSSNRAFDEYTVGNNYLLVSKPYTTWKVKARIATQDSYSEWSIFDEFTTDEDAPSKPEMVGVSFESRTKNLSINWTKPLEENGVLRSYNVELVHYNFSHACDFKPDKYHKSIPADVTNVVFDSSDVFSDSWYSVSVSAVTLKEGPRATARFGIPESVPEAAPTIFEVLRLSKDSYVVKWQYPDCQRTNGWITGFNYTYDWVDGISSENRTELTYGLLTELSPNNVYRFRVSACTVVGCSEIFDEREFTVEADDLNSEGLIITISSSVVGFIFLIVLAILWYFRRRKNQRRDGELQFILSNIKKMPSYANQPNRLYPDLELWCEKFEFPRERLKLGDTLGEGAFGRVVKAKALGMKYQVGNDVAVKTCKDFAMASQRMALLAELLILVEIGKHLNIVNLLGAVTKNFWNGELLIIVEYFRHGNLRDFLQKNRHLFVNQLENEPKNNETENKSDEIPIIAEEPCSSVDFQDDNLIKPISISDLTSYSFQVARGMQYLASKKIVHRDLAARNVLLSDYNIVKICDFGLSRDIYNDGNYVSQDKVFVPIKWHAPESLSDRIYTLKSDVWSYGVFLWEVFSLGSEPYPGMVLDKEFYQTLKNGYRMEKPEHASYDVYKIMLDCWNANHRLRPNFDSLERFFKNKISEQVYGQYLVVFESFSGNVDTVINSPDIPLDVAFVEGEENLNVTVSAVSAIEKTSDYATGSEEENCETEL